MFHERHDTASKLESLSSEDIDLCISLGKLSESTPHGCLTLSLPTVMKLRRW